MGKIMITYEEGMMRRSFAIDTYGPPLWQLPGDDAREFIMSAVGELGEELNGEIEELSESHAETLRRKGKRRVSSPRTETVE